MTVRTTWDQSQLDDEIDNDTIKFLVASGEAMQNEFSSNSPFITGLLANSMSYYTSFGKNTSGVDGVSRPEKKNSVRSGSGLVYAASVETRGKSAGWMSRAWDIMIASQLFQRIQEKVYKI